MIDPALLRPGRLDEMVYVPVPDLKARVKIFRSHTKGIDLDRDMNMEKLAEITDRFTGADIVGVCRRPGSMLYRKIRRLK